VVLALAAEGSQYHACTKIVIIDGELPSASSSSSSADVDDLLPVSSLSTSSSGSPAEFSLCIKRSRERRLYTSNGHVATVYTTTPLLPHLSTAASGNFRSSASAAAAAAAGETRFLLMYRRKYRKFVMFTYVSTYHLHNIARFAIYFTGNSRSISDQSNVEAFAMFDYRTFTFPNVLRLASR
jgi:hypothetical protein